MIDDDTIQLLRDKTQLSRFNHEEVKGVFSVLYAQGFELRRVDKDPAPVLIEPEPKPLAPSEFNDQARAAMGSLAEKRDAAPVLEPEPLAVLPAPKPELDDTAVTEGEEVEHNETH
jgi:hypothetical protein